MSSIGRFGLAPEGWSPGTWEAEMQRRFVKDRVQVAKEANATAQKAREWRENNRKKKE